MKVVHLSTADIKFGAARGAYWLHQALLGANVESIMLVREKLSSDNSVIGAEQNFSNLLHELNSKLDRLPLHLYPNRDSETFSVSWMPNLTPYQVKRLKPDVINLHWIGNGFLRLESIAKFSVPVLWTLRDLWAFTGGCHYSDDCLMYTNSCGSCPKLDSHFDNDLSRKIWNRKWNAWKNTDFTIVAISNWLAERAKESSLFQNKRIEVIHNALDESKFKPIPKESARKRFNLPVNKNIILFCAIAATESKRKGYQYLIAALRRLCSNPDFVEKSELLIVGSSQAKDFMCLPIKIHCTGFLQDDQLLASAYSAADVTVTPSTQEAFGKTAMESLACGTPVVAFKSTGFQDIVDHLQNGYLAEYLNHDDLANGISYILEDEDRYNKFCFAARTKVEQQFTLNLQAKKYINLYKEILESTSNSNSNF